VKDGWEGGFERGFALVKDRALCYGFVAVRGGGVTINTDMVKESEVKGLKDLLDPRWKGKLLLPDVRVMGDAFWPMTAARLSMGDDVVKKLFVDQEPVLSRDNRQVAEFMVRGRYPIALGVNPQILATYQKQGLAKNLKLLHFAEMATMSSSSSTIWLVNRAPHPNAAKVFINWLLTRDAQVTWAKEVETNSRRTGIEPGNPQYAVPHSAAGSVTELGQMWNGETPGNEGQFPVLEIPVGETVRFNLTSTDVVHAFWIVPFEFKRDVIPGRHNQLSFTPDTPGTYLGQCAEFCGTSHANMLVRLIVEPADTFERWMASERAPAAQPTSGPAADGAAVFAASACVGCHTVRGVSSGVIGPDLTHFGGRTTLAAGMLPNTADNVTAWILDPPRIKPGVKMPALGLSEAQARAIAAYLLSLK